MTYQGHDGRRCESHSDPEDEVRPVGRYAIACALASMGITACAGSSSGPGSGGPELVVSDRGGGVAQTTSGADLPTCGSFYVGDVCLAEPGEVEIRGIRLVDPFGGAEITDFATFAFSENLLLYDLSPLREVADYQGGVMVSSLCGDSASITSLAVEIVKPTRESAGGRGLMISYGSSTGEVEVLRPFSPVLCEGLDDPGCDGSG